MQGRYFEAAVTGIDAAKQTLTANFPKHAGIEQYNFEVPYDILVYSVGSVVNTFGIKVGLVPLPVTTTFIARHCLQSTTVPNDCSQA